MSKKSRKKSSKTPSGSPTAKKKAPESTGIDSNTWRESTGRISRQIKQDSRRGSIA